MSFRLKTVLGIAVIEIALLAILVISGLHYLSTSNGDQLFDRARTTAQLFATMTSDAVVAMDLATLDVLAEQTASNPGIVYVRVRHGNGRVLSARGDAEALAAPFAEDGSTADAAGDQRLDVSHPIRVAGNAFGRVEVGLDTADLRNLVDNARQWMLGVAGVEVLLVAVFGYLLGRILTRQLTSLQNGAREVAEGNLGHRIAVRGSDELADTAASFNRMSEALSEQSEALRDSLNRAEAANEAKSRFLAMMSHEIRTPINGVLGILSLLRDTGPTADQAALIRTGRDSGEALLQIINDVLDFSKMEAGKLDFETSNFELRGLIESVLEINGPRAAEKGIDLNYEIDAPVPERFSGDQGRIRQVLMNLVGNAVKFTETGRITVRASLAGRERGASLIAFDVVDTGIGIAEEEIDRLFTDFTTLSPSHSNQASGTGLGLAICKKLVAMMGGDIGCHSRPGAGSTFWFHLVLADADEQAELARPLVGSNRARCAPDTQRRPADVRILLAEDNPTNAMIATRMLENSGYRVVTVADGREAVTAAKAMPFDLVLMDIGMPEMDGLEATAGIRALDGAASDLPIVAMTAHVLAEERQQIMEAGLDDYLAKPAGRDDLLNVVTRWTGVAPAVTVEAPVAAKPADPPAFDDGVLHRLGVETDPALLPELVASFIDHSAERCQAIETARAGGDLAALAEHAHALKSSAAAFGAMALHRLAQELEAVAKAGDEPAADSLGAQIGPARAAAITDLRATLATLAVEA